MIIAIIYLLLKGKSSPIVVMITVPIIAALLVGTSVAEIGEYVGSGIETVTNNAILFIFSIIFFSVMQDLGVFDILVDWLIKVSNNRVVPIMIATGIIGIIAHIDGATATTVLITIPAMYPVFKKLGLKTEILLCLTASAMGVMNLLPWGGPVARAATVLGMDATDLWLQLIPVQLFGIVIVIGLAIFFGFRENKRLAQEKIGAQPAHSLDGNFQEVSGAMDSSTHLDQAEEGEGSKKTLSEKHRKLLPLNVLLTILVIGVLILDVFPSYFVFMVGLSITLIVNFPSLKEQNEIIKKHAGSALLISATMLAAGVMVGIMDGTGMVEAMAAILTDFIPDALGQFTHVIFGIFAFPIGIVTGTDAYFFGFMPPVLEVGAQFGIAPINGAMTMLIGKNLSLMVSPLVPATFLALGLVDIDLKQHMRFSWKYLWLCSLLMLLFAFVTGIIYI